MNITTFSNMTSKIPSPGQLEGLVTFMKEDEKLRFFTESYRKTGNKSYKHDAPLFAVACIFEGGKGKDNIRSLTHLSLVDFDHITEKPDDGTLHSLKERICHDAHTLLCYVTMSGNGLRVIYRYEGDDYPAAFAMGNATTRISSARKAIRSARTSQGSADSPTTPKSISILKPQPSAPRKSAISIQLRSRPHRRKRNRNASPTTTSRLSNPSWKTKKSGTNPATTTSM